MTGASVLPLNYLAAPTLPEANSKSKNVLFGSPKLEELNYYKLSVAQILWKKIASDIPR